MSTFATEVAIEIRQEPGFWSDLAELRAVGIRSTVLQENEQVHDISSLYSGSENFAKVVIRCSNKGSLDAVLLRVARELEISLDEAYVKFTAAVAYGFLTLNHQYDLRPAHRLELIRTSRRAAKGA